MSALEHPKSWGLLKLNINYSQLFVELKSQLHVFDYPHDCAPRGKQFTLLIAI